MATPDSDGLVLPQGPPVAGDEIQTLLGALQRQRSYLEWKCGELDAEGLRATLGPSSVTLGGLLKHLALIEDYRFTRRLRVRELGPPWDGADLDARRPGRPRPRVDRRAGRGGPARRADVTRPGADRPCRQFRPGIVGGADRLQQA